MNSKFRGLGVAMITPFDANGEVDFPALGKLIDYLIDNGLDYLVSLGTTGETATLSKDEKVAIWKYTKERTNGRVPLVAGIGGNNTKEVVNSLKEFDKVGYDAILSVSPYYNKPTQEGIYQHYKALAEASSLPILLYNVPGRTGSCISAETTVKLAHDFKNIIGTKEASGNFDIFGRIFRDKPKDFLVISGDDGAAVPFISLGGDGVISVIANAIPKPMSQMVHSALNGDFATAAKIHASLIDFTAMAFEEGNPAGIKSALNTLNICKKEVRLPLVASSANLDERVKKELQKI